MKAYSFKSDIGTVSLFERAEAIVKIKIADNEFHHKAPTPLMLQAQREIEDYLKGMLETFSFEYSIEGTEFQKDIYQAMQKIPFGSTLSYGELAKQAGHASAARACGSVCKNNPLPLLFPCHRVIKSDGSIGDFNGGIALKKHLLDIEKRH